jgi:hypothetical protein
MELMSSDRPSPAPNWHALHTDVRNYPNCDDGALAEGFSNDVVFLLTDRWGTVGDLAAEIRHDPPFRAFVLKHIDLTAADQTDFQTIANNARNHCPATAADICRLIELAAKAKGDGIFDQEICKEELSPIVASSDGHFDVATWREFYRLYSRYRPCAVSGLEDVVSRTVVRLLTDHWSELPAITGIAESDPWFLDSVVNHIDSDAGIERLKLITLNAGRHCPKGLAELCSRIEARAQSRQGNNTKD